MKRHRYIMIVVKSGVVEEVFPCSSFSSATKKAEGFALMHDPERYEVVVWNLDQNNAVYNPFKEMGR